MPASAWIGRVHTARPLSGVPQMHCGTICTGDKVVANGRLLEDRQTWPKLIGVEMESGGAASAAFQSVEKPGVLMVRGVSDLADPDKNAGATDSWRGYACDVAAAFTVALLENMPIPFQK